MILGSHVVDLRICAHAALKSLSRKVVVGFVFVWCVICILDALYPVNYLVAGTFHRCPAHLNGEIIGRHAARRIVFDICLTAILYPLPILVLIVKGIKAVKRIAWALHLIFIREKQRRTITKRTRIHRRATIVIDGIRVHLAIIVHIHHGGSARHHASLHDVLLNKALNIHIPHFGHAARNNRISRVLCACGVSIDDIRAY